MLVAGNQMIVAVGEAVTELCSLVVSVARLSAGIVSPGFPQVDKTNVVANSTKIRMRIVSLNVWSVIQTPAKLMINVMDFLKSNIVKSCYCFSNQALHSSMRRV